jgi:uncharacterized protein (TIGR02271 family)
MVDADGRRGTVMPEDWPSDRDASQLLVRLESGRHIVVPGDMVALQDDGTYRLPIRFADIEDESATQRKGQEGERVIPVVHEQVRVGRRETETGRVRLTKRVHEREEVVDKPVVREEVQVERVAVNREVKEGTVKSYYDGDTLVIPVVKEVLVVQKRLVVEEEVRVTKKRISERHPQRVTLRSEEVDVERAEPERNPIID